MMLKQGFTEVKSYAFVCTNLKHYIKPFDVYVYSHLDIIKHMLSKPILHSRVGKWALTLTEYSLTYKSLKDVKGQIVADFIADHSIVEVISSFADFIGDNLMNI